MICIHDCDTRNVEAEQLFSDINAHAPVGRRTLSEHVVSGDLTYRTRNGHTCEIARSEILLLEGVCSERERMSLRLPILITTDTSAAQGAWKAEGKAEVSVVSKLISKNPVRDDLILFYHPHLRELQKKLPNAVTVLFVP